MKNNQDTGTRTIEPSTKAKMGYRVLQGTRPFPAGEPFPDSLFAPVSACGDVNGVAFPPGLCDTRTQRPSAHCGE